MKEEKKPEMSLLEWRMRKTAQLLREGKLPSPTGLVGLLPKRDERYIEASKNSESKE